MYNNYSANWFPNQFFHDSNQNHLFSNKVICASEISNLPNRIRLRIVQDTVLSSSFQNGLPLWIPSHRSAHEHVFADPAQSDDGRAARTMDGASREVRRHRHVRPDRDGARYDTRWCCLLMWNPWWRHFCIVVLLSQYFNPLFVRFVLFLYGNQFLDRTVFYC